MKNFEKAFDALGEPMRRAIFEKLKNRPLPVGIIAKGFPVSRPAISQHLRVLKDAGLVKINTQGTRNYYRIDDSGVMAMRDYLDNFWDAALAAFKTFAEKKPKK